MSKAVKHLIEQFNPTNYKLELVPDRESMTFSGKVTIAGSKVGRPTKRITFHQKDLIISRATVVRHDKGATIPINVSRINHHKSYDEVRLHSDELIYPGSVTVELEFSGKITRQMNGIYPCFFEDAGQKKKLIATQFESHHAREAFPCIDEPAAKATFDLSLVAPKGETVLSNTPISSQEDSDDTTTTHFETTPHMSTYLLAFVFGELGYKEKKTKRGTVTRIYATPDNVELTDFALDFAVKCLDFYEDYFGIPYPLKKCDHIALPDFASGAMENWGCITYREQALLIDENHSPLAMKQRVAVVIAHELAHQWFGNLVTMRWWTDLWLNEGFASWIEFLAVDHIFPEWNVWTQFLIDDQQQALRLDALENTHPVEVPINHPDEIRSIFDAISYSKGASVIHMLHDYLGAKDFQAGLKHYLTIHAYKNTDTIDLWKALEEVSGKPVTEFMNVWTSKSGFPLVTANVKGTNVEVKQERFCVNSTQDHEEQLWPIDLQLSADVAQMTGTFNTKQLSFEVKNPDGLLINKGSAGFYRTTYNQSHLKTLGNHIKNGKIEPADRLSLLANVTEAAKAGKASTVDALELLSNFSGETDYAVWDTITNVLGSIRMTMNEEELREAMKPFTRKLAANEVSRLGWEKQANESHFDQLLRPVILGMAAGADDKDVVSHAKELFAAAQDVEDINPELRSNNSSDKNIKRNSYIDPDIRGVVFGTAARLGDKHTFDKLVKLYRKAHLSDEKVTIAAALTGFKQKELISRALDMIKSEDVRLQDVAYWVAYSFVNRHARELTWGWLQENWGWLEENLGSDLSFYRTPIYVARVHNSTDFIKDYKAFFEPKITPALERSYLQGLEMLQWQSAWKQRDYDKILNYFKSNQ